MDIYSVEFIACTKYVRCIFYTNRYITYYILRSIKNISTKSFL